MHTHTHTHTPIDAAQETSGHAAHYKENMFQIEIEKQLFGLKPMNCPGEGVGCQVLLISSTNVSSANV